MESSSKLKLDRSQLEKIVRHAFGDEKKLLSAKENHEGWFNALYSLNIEGIGEVFLKAAPPRGVPCLRYEKDIIRTETAVLHLLEEYVAIPAPKVLFEDESRSIIESDYFIMEKLAGSSYVSIRDNIEGAEKQRLNREKGRISREINSIKGELFGLYSPESKKYGTWKEAFLKLADDILDDALKFGAPLPLPPDRFREIFRERSACLDSVKEPSLIHWDLHDGNILIGADGKISGIIDCDRAMWGDPAIEFYFSEMFPEETDFAGEYGPELKSHPDYSCRRELYDLYLALIFVIECQSRKVNDKAHIEWAENILHGQIEKMGIG